MSEPSAMKEEPLQQNEDHEVAMLLDEHGQPFEPPLLLVADIVRMRLLGKAQTRRVQEMIAQGVLPARKASKEEELSLLRNNRVRSITVKGIYVIDQAALEYARQHRQPIGFPKGRKRSQQASAL